MLGRALRHQFLLDPGVDYLNNGGWGAAPRVVLDAQRRWQEALAANPTHFQMVRRPALLDTALQQIGTFLGASSENLAFVDNATTASNVVVGSLPLVAGDEVLTTTHVYGALRNLLHERVVPEGVAVVEVPIPVPMESWEPVIDAVRAAITPRTRLAIFDHIASPSGLVLPVQALIEVCRARGVPVYIDGAHAPGQLPLDLEALGADWYAGNLHKWAFAPPTAAVLYAAPHRQANLRATIVSAPSSTWRDALHWPGSSDPSAWLAGPDGLDFLEDLGAEAVYEHCRDLARRTAARLADTWKVGLPFDPDFHAAMVVIPVPGRRPRTSAEAGRLMTWLFETHGVVVPVFFLDGQLWVRISAAAYNEDADYDALEAAFSPETKG